MFDCCRIPGQEGLDWGVSFAKEGDDGTSGHIVVFRRGQVWRVDPWQNGRLLSVAELERYVGFFFVGCTVFSYILKADESYHSRNNKGASTGRSIHCNKPE